MSSDEQFNKRPNNEPSVTELVHYLLQSEIVGMSKLGSYSGIVMPSQLYLVLMIN